MSIPASLSNLEGNHLDRMDVMVLLDLIGAKNPTFMSTQVQIMSCLMSHYKR